MTASDLRKWCGFEDGYPLSDFLVDHAAGCALSPGAPCDCGLWTPPCPYPVGSAEPAVAVPGEPEQLLFFDWDDGYPFYGEPLPSLVPEGCDVYLAGKRLVQYVWLRVDYLGEGPARAGDRHVGRRTAGHDQVVDDVGWAAVLDVCGDVSGQWVRWLLAEGLAPGQPFLVRAGYAVRSNGFGEVDDDDWDIAVVARAPWCTAESANAWRLAMTCGGAPVPLLPRGWLPCPACDEDAVPSSSYGCLTCGWLEGDAFDHPAVCHGRVEALWDEGDGGPCPECGADLRVVVDDDRSYAEEREP